MSSPGPVPDKSDDAVRDQRGLTRRNFLALGGGVSAAVLLGACGGSSKPPTAAPAGGNGGAKYSGPPVKLAFWNGFTGGDEPYIKKIVDQFNTQAKNITVTMNVYQWVDFFQKLPAAVASGNGPDVAAMHVDDIPTNAAQQTIVPIDDVAKALNLKESDFSPVVWKGGLYNGKRYGIPLDIHPLGMYYNKKLMSEAGLDPNKPPMSDSEMMSALEALKGKGIQGFWMSPFQFTGGFTFQSLLWQYGGDTFDANVTKATFDSQAGVQALTWMVDLVKKGYSPRNVGQDADYLAFKNNKNAFNWNGIWQVNDCASTPNLEWGAGPVAQIGTQQGVWANSHQFVLPRQTTPDPNKQNASRYFINWMSQHSLEWAKSGKVPARASVRQSAQFQSLSPENKFAQELPYVHFPKPVPGIGDALTEMYNGVQQGVLMRKDPASALKDAAAKATQVVQSNAKKYGTG